MNYSGNKASLILVKERNQFKDVQFVRLKKLRALVKRSKFTLISQLKLQGRYYRTSPLKWYYETGWPAASWLT